MELRDVYTRDGFMTGRVWEQGTPRTRGDYYSHAVIILRTRSGKYPLAQRSLDNEYFPGRWDVTGGGVRHGESPIEGAVREAREELGITADPSECRPIYSFILDYEDGTGSLVTVYGCTIPDGLEYTIDKSEVNAVREVGFQEFHDSVMYNKDSGFGTALKRFEDSFDRAAPFQRRTL